MTSIWCHRPREDIVYGTVGKKVLTNIHNKDLEPVLTKIFTGFDVI